MEAEIPEKLGPFWDPHRYKVAYGGRGSAKSWTAAQLLLLKGLERRLRILCAREIQKTIQASVHELLRKQIHRLGLRKHYAILQSSIRGINGTEFVFSGLRTNVNEIKSMEGIDIVWVEEAQSVSEDSWSVLIPTIRQPGSEIWVTFNPMQEEDPTYQRFVVNPPPDCVSIALNWDDNLWFPEELRKEKDYDYAHDPELAEHVWGGKTKKNSVAQVLRGRWVVEDFIPLSSWDGPYYGADWGFGVDPTALVKVWINGRELYVEHEAYGVGVDIDDTPKLFDTVPGASKHIIRADCSRPETISYMQRHGYGTVIGCAKGAGSVDDGVEHLRSYERIVIHPRCKHTAQEARLWSYKTDRGGNVLPVLKEGQDHCLIGETKIFTMDGEVPIKDLVGRRGQLWTLQNGKIVLSDFDTVRCTSDEENVYRVFLSNGRTIEGTSEHMLLTEYGWKPLLALGIGMKLFDYSDALRYVIDQWQKKYSFSTDSNLFATLRRDIIRATAEIRSPGECTELFGKTRTEQFRRVFTYIIKTAIDRIIRSQIWRCCQLVNTVNGIGRNLQKFGKLLLEKTWLKRFLLQSIGTQAQREGLGIRSTQERSPLQPDSNLEYVNSAEKSIQAKSRDVFALMLANRLRDGSRELIWFRDNVLCVEPLSATTKTDLRRLVGKAVPCVSVIGIEFCGRQAVYNLEVLETHRYFIAGGVVSSNCWDSVRYSLEPIIQDGKPKPIAQPPPPKRRDYRIEHEDVDNWKTV